MQIVLAAGRCLVGLWAVWTLAAAALADDIKAETANWISNPSFEEGDEGDPVDWAFFKEHETTSGRCDADTGREGSRGVAIEGRGGLSFGRWITPYRIPLEPNAEYRMSFWYRGEGGHVYVIGQPTDMRPDGTLLVDLQHRFKTTVARLGPSDDWTFHEKSFRSPGRPCWAQVCLSGGGRKACCFDDVYLEKPGITLLEPRVPQVVPEGTILRFLVTAPELRQIQPGAVRWTTGPTLEMRDARPDEAAGRWVLTAAAVATGPLEISCGLGGDRALRLEIPNMVRVFSAGMERLFGVAIFTDAHFYRPGSNERNDFFGKTVAAITALDPLFSVALGDQMDVHNGLRDEEKKWICEAVRQQMNRLSIPAFTVAGNHEVDRCYEGPGTRWYHEKLLGQPRSWGFRIGGVGFAGVDLSTPGIAAREHGGSFLVPEQSRWLEGWLADAKSRSVVLCGHISPFGDWSRTPDRDHFLSLLLGGKVSTFLCGHEHLTADTTVATAAAPPWPKPSPWPQGGVVGNDHVAVLTTTTVCAFPLGQEKTLGYRYMLLKEGRVAWQGVLPPTLSVERMHDKAGVVEFVVTNGEDKAVVGLPLIARCPDGNATATVDGSPVARDVIALGDGGQVVCVQVDVPKKTKRRVVVTVGDGPQD